MLKHPKSSNTLSEQDNSTQSVYENFLALCLNRCLKELLVIRTLVSPTLLCYKKIVSYKLLTYFSEWRFSKSMDVKSIAIRVEYLNTQLAIYNITS